MNKKARVRERLKTALIIVLAAGVVLLGSMTGLYSQLLSASPAISAVADSVRFWSRRGTSGEESGSEQKRASWDIATVSIAVVSENGARCAAKYDIDKTQEMYNRFSAYLGEALGSAGEPQSVDESVWRAALNSPGVYFDFMCSAPLSVVTDRLGTNAAQSVADYCARRLCLYRNADDGLLLGFMADDGGFYSCMTGLNYSQLSEKISAYAGNGAKFGFELIDELPGIEHYALILDTVPAVYDVSCSAPDMSTADEKSLLSVFAMNSYVASSYTEADGTRVFVEGGGILRADTAGRVVYRLTGDSGMTVGDGGTFTEVEAVNAALSLVNSSVGQFSGDGELFLSELTFDRLSGRCTVSFDYSVDGIPVDLGGEHAAQVQMASGAITAVRLNYRSFAVGNELQHPLPERLAAAIVGASGGGETVLTYIEGAQNVSLEWKINKTEK